MSISTGRGTLELSTGKGRKRKQNLINLKRGIYKRNTAFKKVVIYGESHNSHKKSVSQDVTKYIPATHTEYQIHFIYFYHSFIVLNRSCLVC